MTEITRSEYTDHAIEWLAKRGVDVKKDIHPLCPTCGNCFVKSTSYVVVTNAGIPFELCTECRDELVCKLDAKSA